MRRLLAVAAVAGLVVTGFAVAGADTGCDERIPGVRPGVCLAAPGMRPDAPAGSAPVLGESGETRSVDDFAGQVLVVNFWASWCGPCRDEQPELNDAAAALPDDEVAFLGVDVQDSEANALAHEREFDIPYASLYDPASAYAAEYGGIGPRSIPSTVIIDQQGRVAARLFGTTSATEVTVLVELLLREA